MSYYLEEQNRILTDALGAAKKKIIEQNTILQQLLEQPTIQGVVVSIRGKKVLVSTAQGLVEVAYPAFHALDMSRINIKNGSGVRLLTSPSPAIVEIIDLGDWVGDLAVASNDGKDGSCEVDWQGNTRVIRYGTNVKVPEAGDRLMVDERIAIAIKNLGPDESKFSADGTVPVQWTDIGGLVLAKETLIEAIELPRKYPELYRKYNKKPVKGVLLYGPPGCGKTMLGKATATSIAASLGKQGASTGFIYVKGPEMLDRYVGNTEAKVRGLFARARKHQKLHGYPAVLFIDEADAILGKRDGRPGMGIEATVVPQFLSEMDGLDNTGPIVLLATNRPTSLDSAVTRDGRIDRKVQVTRPDQSGAAEIFKLYLKNCPMQKSVKLNNAAEASAEYLYNSKFGFYNLMGEDNKSASFTLAGLVNGAMIAGVVDKATTIAMLRDLKNGGNVEGISMTDLQSAIDSVYLQNKNLNHEIEVEEFLEQNNMSLKHIIKSPTVVIA